MRILCVNARLPLPPSVAYGDFTTANVLQDYDAVVVDPTSLKALYGNGLPERMYLDGNMITSEAGDWVKAINEKRRDEVEGLLELGGVVVCFMQPRTVWRYQVYVAYLKWEWADVTNYDWLGSDLLDECWNSWEAGRGEKVSLVGQSHPFGFYLNAYLKKKPSWTAFVRHEKDYSHWRVLVNAYGTHDLALSRRQGRGHIVLLPSGRFDGDTELLEGCIRSLLGQKEPREKPTWVREIMMPKQNEILEEIQHTEDEIDRLNKERDKLSTSNEQLERWKWLLWETGRDHLEPVVREALTLMGCQVESQPVEESDGKVVSEFGTALLEVEGTVDTVTRNKLAQLVRNRENFLTEKQMKPKCIFVGNPFRKQPPDNRPPKGTQKNLFSKELIEDAEKQDIAVLLSTDLYKVVCGILDEAVSEVKKKELRQAIFEGKGLVRLQPP